MKNRLSRIDLNLLVTYLVLMEEGSVTSAAHRLNLTQPAMSRTLQRLREQFGDPLFTRTPRGITPTPFAKNIEFSIRKLLSDAEDIFFAPKFDPQTSTECINISAPEVSADNIILELLVELRKLAPQVMLNVQNPLSSAHPHSDYKEMLQTGAIDFCLDYKKIEDLNFHNTLLKHVRPCLWVNNKHPLVKKRKISIEDIYQYPISVLHLPKTENYFFEIISRELKKLKLNQNIALKTDSLFLSIEFISRSNAVMITASDLSYYNITNKLYLKPIKLDDVPLFSEMKPSLYLIEHERTKSSLMHKWIREKIVEAHTRCSQID
jgi:DNA-binding transcriptional LysR family regulator